MTGEQGKIASGTSEAAFPSVALVPCVAVMALPWEVGMHFMPVQSVGHLG